MQYCPVHQRAWYPGNGVTTETGKTRAAEWYTVLPHAVAWAAQMAQAFPAHVRLEVTPCDRCQAGERCAVMSYALSETKGPPSTCEHQPHVPPFDALRASRMPPDEIRRMFPRYDGICSLCAAKIKVYASLDHYQAGGWAEMPVETPKDTWD